MSDCVRARRRRLLAPLLAALLVGSLSAAWLAAPASANDYGVVSCDAAPPTFGTAAWGPGQGSVNSYFFCPSNLDGGRGMVTRMVGRNFGAGEFSTLWFFAPVGTNIAGISWAGRVNRNNPSWAAELNAIGPGIQQRIMGLGAAPGAGNAVLGYEYKSPVWLAVPPGTTALSQNTQCGAGSCAPGATFHTYYAHVILHDWSAPSVSMTGVNDNEWVRADRTISFSAADNLGISSAHLRIDGNVRQGGLGFFCDSQRTVPCSNQNGAFALPTSQLAPGKHVVEVLVYDGSGTPVSTGRTIWVDNAAPKIPPLAVAPPATPKAPNLRNPDVPVGEDWRNANGFTVTWPSQKDGGSPITKAVWELCKPGRTACQTGELNKTNPTGLTISVPAEGTYELRIVLRDLAGNARSLADAPPVRLRLDRTAPSVAIERLDPNDPMRAVAAVADPVSGLAVGQLEMRRRGTSTWRELPTVTEPTRLAALVDDERYADGTYELRARAVDRAGNETSTDPSGAAATRQLPLRIRTRLHSGRQVVRVVRRKVGRGKHRRVVRQRRLTFKKNLIVTYNRYRTIRGVLTNLDGAPLVDVPIEVAAQPLLPGAGFAPTLVVRTDKEGKFKYRVRGSMSKTLRFRYAGTSRIRPSTAEVDVKVPAQSTLSLSPRNMLNGGTVTFSGRLRGGPVPATGKLIELRKWDGTKWASFRVVKANAAGRWSWVEPVLSVARLTVFRLRAHVPPEAGFPFAAGRSPARTLCVMGTDAHTTCRRWRKEHSRR